MFAQWRTVFEALGFVDDGRGSMTTTLAGRRLVARRHTLFAVTLSSVAPDRAASELPWDVDVQTAGAAMRAVVGVGCSSAEALVPEASR